MNILGKIAFLALFSASCSGTKNFTVIVLPDTQNYVSYMNDGMPETFTAQTRWIAQNRESLNIVFVTHLGDLVARGDSSEAEWVAAEDAMGLLEDPVSTGMSEGIPYGIALGNHDQSRGSNGEWTTVEYNRRFGIDRFADRSYYGGHYGEDNDNNYELFSGGDYEFVIIHLEFDREPSPKVLAWADSVLSDHADRYAFISTHHIINPGNPGEFGRQGAEIYAALKHHSNLFMMLGAHVPRDDGEGQRSDTFNGVTVHSLLSNYQAYENGGNGWLRIMQFSPSKGSVSVRTYSPTINEGAGGYLSDDNSEFELLVDFSRLD